MRFIGTLALVPWLAAAAFAQADSPATVGEQVAPPSAIDEPADPTDDADEPADSPAEADGSAAPPAAVNEPAPPPADADGPAAPPAAAGGPDGTSDLVDEPEDSPEAVQKTEDLNQGQAADGRQINETYQEQQRQYQEQLRRYKAAREKYENQTDHYRAQRDRYLAERARYHRGEWPTHYRHLGIADSDELMGARVETYAGDRVGRVVDVAKGPNGRVDALRVKLGRDGGHVWIDAADLRFDPREGLVMTNLDRSDLRTMAERD